MDSQGEPYDPESEIGQEYASNHPVAADRLVTWNNFGGDWRGGPAEPEFESQDDDRGVDADDVDDGHDDIPPDTEPQDSQDVRDEQRYGPILQTRTPGGIGVLTSTKFEATIAATIRDGHKRSAEGDAGEPVTLGALGMPIRKVPRPGMCDNPNCDVLKARILPTNDGVYSCHNCGTVQTCGEMLPSGAPLTMVGASFTRGGGERFLSQAHKLAADNADAEDEDVGLTERDRDRIERYRNKVGELAKNLCEKLIANKKATCVADSLASAVHAAGDATTAQLIADLAPGSLTRPAGESRVQYVKDKCAHSLRPVWTTHNLKSAASFDPLSLLDVGPNVVTLLQLKDSSGHLDHSVAIWCGQIFDYNKPCALKLSKEGLDSCCLGNATFVSVVKGFRLERRRA